MIYFTQIVFEQVVKFFIHLIDDQPCSICSQILPVKKKKKESCVKPILSMNEKHRPVKKHDQWLGSLGILLGLM